MEIMENLTEEQQIARLEIMLDVCRRDKDALRYQLDESKRNAAEQSVQRIGFKRPLVARLGYFFIRKGRWLVGYANR